MKPKLAIVTGNPLKYRELSTKLSEFFECEQKVLENYFEIQGTPEEILRHKLLTAYEAFQEPVLSDDTSVYFEALSGLPGPYIKDFFKLLKPWEMGEKFAGTRIKVVCSLGLCRGNDDVIFGTGSIEGDIVMPKTHDDKATVFDLFIQIDGTDRPMIEMSPEEKNMYSHRGRALDALIAQLS